MNCCSWSPQRKDLNLPSTGAAGGVVGMHINPPPEWLVCKNYCCAVTESSPAACACMHTHSCQPIISDWQLFLKSCLLFCLLLSCLCSCESLADAISPFHTFIVRKISPSYKTALRLIPLHHPHHHGQLFAFPFQRQTSSLCCRQPISLIHNQAQHAVPFQQRFVLQQPLSCRHLQTPY